DNVTSFLKVKPSGLPDAGWGLFACDNIPSGSFLGDYCGKLVFDTDFEFKSDDGRMTLVAVSKCSDPFRIRVIDVNDEQFILLTATAPKIF
ncbi:uncharacterized protein PV06_11197, partial [Exophiala oligosperma]